MRMIYSYSFRFNALHDTSSELNSRHAHTFELVCKVEQPDDNCRIIESEIQGYLYGYYNRYLNDIIDGIPTIENIAEKMFEDLSKYDEFKLLRVELSDKPVQTYIIERTGR